MKDEKDRLILDDSILLRTQERFKKMEKKYKLSKSNKIIVLKPTELCRRR